MTTDMRETIEAMLAGLKGVTPGPWKHTTDKASRSISCTVRMGAGSGKPLAEIWHSGSGAEIDANAAHIARCDPDTIRELCRLAKIGMNAEREPVFDLRAFSRENRARCEAPNGFRHPLSGWSLAEWLNAVTGELGEVAGAIKEMLRARDGVPNKGWSPDVTRQNLSAEIADTAIYLDLLAQAAGLDLASAIRAKFDLTSAKVGYTVGGEHD